MHGQGHVVSVAALNAVIYQPFASSWVPNSTPMLQLGGKKKPNTFKDMLEFDGSLINHRYIALVSPSFFPFFHFPHNKFPIINPCH
jgi:hypothetical protein